MDLRALIVCDFVIALLFGIAYLVYLSQQKTYPGFKAWTIGTFVMAAGYLAAVLRDVTPTGLSIVLMNTALVLATVIRLDAIRRFVLSKPLPRAVYALPVVTVLTCAVFYYALDLIAVRGVVVTLAIVFTLVWFILILLRNQPQRGRALYRFAAGLVAVGAVALLVRAGLWLVHPEQTLLDAGWSHALVLFIALAGETGLGVIILMLTGQRSQAELIAAHEELQAALAEVKTLRGILPICLHCKSVRTDEGSWQRVETYVREHSDADFSHGICPECAKKHYPDIDFSEAD